MGFGEAIASCFRNYVGFGGRASRSEYWFWVLFTVIAAIILGIADFGVFGVDDKGEPRQVFGPIFSLVTFLPGMAVCFRRLHDTDRSGWWVGGAILLMFIGGIAVGIASASLGGGIGSMMAVIGLVCLAFFVWAVVLIVFLCLPGTPGPNRFGENPLMLMAPPTSEAL